ncbi:MAG: LOG family protein [Melioribacteraceae bacterium]|nr:LOG family protein [Melioribacteraceae bacterium]
MPAVIMPGGFGTIDEFFEVLTLIQTGKTMKVPIVVMGTEYWEPLMGWLKEYMIKFKYIEDFDMDLFKMTDDPKEAANFIYEFHKGTKIIPNF